MVASSGSGLGVSSFTDPVELLELGRGIFGLILFAVSLFSWYRRRQPALIVVSVAFLLFFVKTIIDTGFPPSAVSETTRLSMDFLALALFFIAVVLRPRKDVGGRTVVSQPVES